jgi:hypothetical protein
MSDEKENKKIFTFLHIKHGLLFSRTEEYVEIEAERADDALEILKNRQGSKK